jgi:hypothetical protein
MVTDHATLVHLLKESSDNLSNTQTHWVENMTPYANSMCIIYTKGILNEADLVPRRPDFLSIENPYMPFGSFWWDGKRPGIDTNGNDHIVVALSILEALNVDDDFRSQLKGVYST